MTIRQKKAGNKGLAKWGAEVLNSTLVILFNICAKSELTYFRFPHFAKPLNVTSKRIGRHDNNKTTDITREK